MNLTALGLMSPKFKKGIVRSLLEQRFPMVAKATSASRFVRSDGKGARFVYLYAKPDKPNDAHNGTFVGRCLPKTIELFVEAGLWQRSSARFTDHQPDTGYDRWYPVS